MKKIIINALFIVATLNLFSQYTFNSPTDSNIAYENQVFSPYTQFFGGVITGLAVALPFNMLSEGEGFSKLNEKITLMYVGYTLGSAIGVCLFSNHFDFYNGLMTLLGSGIGGAIGYLYPSWVLSLLLPPLCALIFNNYFPASKYYNSNGFSFKITEVSQIIKTMPEDRNPNYQISFSWGI